MLNKIMNTARKTKGIVLLVFVSGLIVSYNENKVSETKKYKLLGDSIAVNTQADLLKKLSLAIADSGYAFAVEFCNINVTKITNTRLDNDKIISIQRLSDRNRNPQNATSTETDVSILKSFKKTAKDTVVVTNGNIVYYKPIKIMIPTCLKCHGNKKEMDQAAYNNIKKIYPNDLAIDYKEGDLRGIWKIQLKK